MAAAIGAGLPITEPSGNMVVDIGGGTTEVAVISLAGIVVLAVDARRRRQDGRGDHRVHQAQVQPADRRAHGRAHQEADRQRLPARTRSRPWRSRGATWSPACPRPWSINSDEIREALAEPMNAIVEAVRSVLERTPPELAADIVDKGIVLTGGGALLQEPRRAAARGDRAAGDGLRLARVRGGAGHRQRARRARPCCAKWRYSSAHRAIGKDGRGQ